ncbi:MAG: DUF2953 domain-containing protein [Lachnospiraceae bacterium]|nr:DUF2953 domain-containing protein [Lachnospiraceae bacterium]
MAVLLTILLTILKVIGIVLLAVIGLSLLILAIVLFVPVRYEVSGEFEENKGGEAGISWLGPLIRIRGGYYFGNELFYWAKVFGLLVYSSGDEKTIFTKFRDWKEKRAKKKAAKPAVIKEHKEHKEQTDTSQFSSYAQRVENDNNISDYNPPGNPAKENAGTEAGKPDTGDGTSGQSDTGDEPTGDGPAEKLRKLIKKAQAFAYEAKNKTDAFYEKVEDGMDKIERIEKFYYENESQHTVQKLLKLIKRTIAYVMPTKGDGYICYGWWDPATTGKIYGICCALGLVVGRQIEIIPDFSRATFHCKLDVKGRIRVFYFVRTGLVIILDKKIRHVYKKGKKVIGHE